MGRIAVVAVACLLLAPVSARASAPTWLSPENHLDPAGYTNIYDEKVAFNARGDAAAVWQSSSDTSGLETLFASVRRAGGGWAPAAETARPRSMADGLTIAAADAGDTMVLWYTAAGIFEQYRRAGGDWFGSVRLIAGGFTFGPSVAFDSHGTATIAYD